MLTIDMTAADPWLPEQAVENVKAYVFRVVVAANGTDLQVATARDSSGPLLGRMRVFRDPNLVDGSEVFTTGAAFVDDPTYHATTAAGTYYFVLEWNLDNAGSFRAGRSFSIARADIGAAPPPASGGTIEPVNFRGVAYRVFVNDAPANGGGTATPAINWQPLPVAVGDPSLASESLAEPGPDSFAFANYKVYAWKFRVTPALVNFYTRTAQVFVGLKQPVDSFDAGNACRFRLYRADALEDGSAIKVSASPFGNAPASGGTGTVPAHSTGNNTFGLGALEHDGLAENAWYVLTLVVDAEGANGSFDPPASMETRFCVQETVYAP